MRLDQFLVTYLNIESRNKAQALIESEQVVSFKTGKEVVLKKASYDISEDEIEFVKIKNDDILKYVSRAGFKLEGAIQHTEFNINGKTVLDVGQSTGGFTDCALQFGAKNVVGIDVGEAQVHSKIRSYENAICLEKINARYLHENTEFHKHIPLGGFDIIVCDVSFISILQVFPSALNFLRTEGHFLLLIKPQFECGPENLNKNGIVKSASVYHDIEKRIKETIQKLSCTVLDYFESSIEGKDGNKEFFIYGKKN